MNPATSFMQPRDDKANFIKNFSPDKYPPHICESNGWQQYRVRLKLIKEFNSN